MDVIMILLKHKIINKMIIYGFICLAVFLIWVGVFYISDMDRRESQKRVFTKLTNLTAEELSSVELQFVKEDKLIEQKCFLTNSDLQEFLGFFNEVDFMQDGGHNRRVYLCIIVLKYKNGNEDKFVGKVYSVYEFNKDALYIYKYFFRQSHEYYLESENGLPIRVPKLGKWIMEKYPLGKL